MNCDDVAKYRVQIKYKETANATGVIVKLDEFPNHFFVFTAKHTFGNDKIEKNRVEILHDDVEYKIVFDSYIALETDIVVFVCKNSSFVNIREVKPIKIADTKNDFKECLFTGYPKNVDGHYCEKCDYHEEVKDNLYRIEPRKDTDSYSKKGLLNSKGYSGSGLFIKSENNYELVGIIKEHENNKSAFHYIALAPLKDDILTKINDTLYNDVTIPQHLIDEIKNNNVVLFVGNDFSTNFGFPSKLDLFDEILTKVDSKYAYLKMGVEQGGMPLDTAFTLLKPELNEIKNTIVELYSTTPQNKHFIKTLWKFTSDIVTVNYDNFLEEDIGDVNIVSADNNYKLPKNKNFKKLFKLHGGVSNIDNILIFEDEYKELYSKREIKSIQNFFRDKTCLFIGFSTDEVYFDWMYQSVSCKNKNYIISTSQKDFSRYNFEPIIIENYNQLNKAFNEALKEEITIAKQSHIRKVSDIKVQESKAVEEHTQKVCIYIASPLNSHISYRDKIGTIMNQFKKYSVKVYHKTLNEDNLLDFYGEYDYNFIFTHTNKEKIIIEDEYFMQKSIDLDELEEMVESDNTVLFLDKKITDSSFDIYEIRDYRRIRIKPFLHKSNYFEKGKSKEYLSNTDLPELIDRKNLNNFVGRVTDLENIIKKILTVKEENKILTIKGSGGIGKTTVISKAVVEIADRGKFKEGIKFVQCEFIQDYNNFENKITHAFDMTNAFEFKRQLKEQDLDENRLIILDNIETLLCLDDTVAIKELIRFISDYATIVITSREILNEIDYEEVYELHKLTTDEAEELFLTLYSVKKYNKKLLRVTILENLLDNNPLAIKLITKNLVKGKSLESLKEELEESFFNITSDDIENIFDKESDINIERTKSLFQSINYSYTRLNDREKLVLELLSLFPDGMHLENFKNFYNKNQEDLVKGEKDKKVYINSFSERDIKSLEDKSLLIINNEFVMLQSIIGRFAEFKFNQREPNEKKEYYEKAYSYNEFVILVVHNLLKNDFKQYIRSAIFDNNKNNFIKSLEYIISLDKDDRKLRYVDRVADSFAIRGAYNEQLVNKIGYLKENYVINVQEKDFLESVDIGLKYFYGSFEEMYEEIQKKFPLKIIVKNNLETSIKEHFIENIFGIYIMEGFVIEYIKFYLKHNLILSIGELFEIGEFQISKKILDKTKEKEFFEYEFQLAIGELNIDELKRYVKSIFKTEHINKVQSTYTLLKADSESVDKKMIKKLIVVNPFTDGLKSLMFAMKENNDKSKELFEEAIKKLFHIKYYYVEAILIYCRYLKDREDDEYNIWFSKGKELAKKYYYRYLQHQFICLDSGVYTEYDENNYPLPEKLDYSWIIKKYGLKV